MHEHLVKKFEAAGLLLKLSDKPIVPVFRGGNDIVQIDIGRKVNGSRRFEWFRIFPGATDNRIQVVGADKRIGQVVLMVHEAEREFEEKVPFTTVRHLRERSPEGWIDLMCRENMVRRDRVRVVSRGDREPDVFVTRKTRSTKRHFLMGLDERQLFIAQLPRAVSTVREAHESLKTGTVTLAEGKVGKATRQGEWFFLPASKEELGLIELGLKKNLLVVERTVPIGPFTDGSVRGPKVRQGRGNPHTADELIVVAGKPVEGRWAVRAREVFIRGRVRHIDHETVSFSKWVKVIRNAEPNQGQALGVGWVD